TPSTINLATHTATFNVDPGEYVRCSFTNTGSNARRSGITIETLSQAGEVSGPQLGFKGDPCVGNVETEFALTVPSSTVCATGTGSFEVSYTSIPPPPSLTLLPYTTPSDLTPSTINLATHTATFNVDPGEYVRCSFTNTGSNA